MRFFSDPGKWEYDTEEDRRINGLHNRFTGTALGLVLVFAPELYKLHKAGHNAVMTAMGFGIFVIGSVLHMLFIDKPIRKKLRYDKRSDFHSAGVGLLIFAAGVGVLLLRLKLGLY